MKWMRERDLLIAQTMAFVESVTGRKPEAEVFARTDLPAVTATRLPDVEAMLAEKVVAPEPPKAMPMARPAGRSEYQNDIQARVEKFRAHQARFNRERDAYCDATVAKMQATLDRFPVPRSSK
jgi:hypothetical protein